MTIDIVPFILYLILFCFVISWIPFFKKSGISVWVLIGLFCIKVAVGVVYGMYLKTPAFVDKADTWRFYRESLPETQLLLHHPRRIFSKEELLEHLYDFNWEHHSNVIEAHVSNLRRKLEAAAPGAEPLIETKRGRGYRLSAGQAQ